ncbi:MULTISPECIES: sporulation-specific diadenylate cyclase CdaS [unclassified Paenibacillus]|uniref:sporulation-specific diadenylate cyclase CdaS n=1 Tax=unclassified Paenibacillus TaxID=185978 RepID=UPI001AE1442C|nr:MULTISPECIES: sporulation-specific diadenylate cyclase CdaS [unclassified Paenibacillus]MBP1153772.1 uncharacterized protein (TIGR00159 family) [Paenibacillus sp. PvP091]MBP1170843.1 uncharacterized protein (TIGR00159 family) [Paenibacillus sp. PvR098]MBP2441871.1 uncharacterized protein (TIGR00159 family) [Paenibacillus sp. PvP052]
MDQHCDFSPLKLELKEQIQALIDKMQQTLHELDEETTCILNDFGQIGEEINTIESLAASFYLKCYLSTYTDQYSEISRSVRNLSQRRHGALIVVQREDSLDGLITPGVSIDANLTYSLLESVFVPGSPLHDGAVLLKSNKIASAANVLPLTGRITDRKLGTRHRAALGLTEQCDALVIVVSEETGKASFCVQGKIYAFATG